MKVSEIMAKYEPFALDKPTYGCVSRQSLSIVETWLYEIADADGVLSDPIGDLVTIVINSLKHLEILSKVEAYAMIDCLYCGGELAHNASACEAILEGPLWFKNLINGYHGCYVWTRAEVYCLREDGPDAFSERFGAHRSWKEIHKRNLDTLPLWFPCGTGDI